MSSSSIPQDEQKYQIYRPRECGLLSVTGVLGPVPDPGGLMSFVGKPRGLICRAAYQNFNLFFAVVSATKET